jgi:hypothetical protein
MTSRKTHGVKDRIDEARLHSPPARAKGRLEGLTQLCGKKTLCKRRYACHAKGIVSVPVPFRAVTPAGESLIVVKKEEKMKERHYR